MICTNHIVLLRANYTKKHRGGCKRGLLRPGPSITNRARSVRLVIEGKGRNNPCVQALKCFFVLLLTLLDTWMHK